MTSSRSFLLICTVGIFCFISYNMVRMPVLALFAEQLGAGPERIGLIVSVSTLTGVLLKLPSGALSDIYGRRFLLRIGVVAFGLPPFVYPFITDLNSLTALRFMHGLATAIFAPSALATVAELYRERRGAALGTYTACTQSGALLGPFIGGYLAHVAGFNLAFVTAGVCGCIAIVLFYSLHLDVATPRVPQKGMRPLLAEMWKGFVVVARNRKVLITSATDGAKMIANGALMAFLPLYGLTVGLNSGEVGLLFSVQAGTSFFSGSLANAFLGVSSIYRLATLVGIPSSLALSSFWRSLAKAFSSSVQAGIPTSSMFFWMIFRAYSPRDAFASRSRPSTTASTTSCGSSAEVLRMISMNASWSFFWRVEVMVGF